VYQQHIEDAIVTDTLTISTLTGAAPPSDDVVAIISVLVPIVAIVMGIGIAMLGLWFDFRKKREMFQLHHAERMAAIEKGIDVPPLPPEFFRDFKKRNVSPTVYLRRGLMWLLIGLAVTAALWGSGERRDAWWGLVPVGVGLAFVLSYLIERGRPAQPEEEPRPPPP
jgi:hypothetical protein